MNILIYDDNLGRAKALAGALCGEEVATFISYNGKFLDADAGTISSWPSSWDIILWHKANQEAFDAANLTTTCAISFSGDGRAEIPRALSARDGFSKEEAAHIVRSLKTEGNGDQAKERILAYWGGWRTARYALRLLCQAWEYPAKEPDRIKIHPPERREDWFARFKRNEQENLPSSAEVALLMGDEKIGAKAKAVLDAADGVGNLADAVKVFLAATDPKVKPSTEQAQARS